MPWRRPRAVPVRARGGRSACGGRLRRDLHRHRCGRASRCLRAPGRSPCGLAGAARERIDAAGGGLACTTSGGDHAPRSTMRVIGDAHDNAAGEGASWAEPRPRLDRGARPGRSGVESERGIGSERRIGRGIGRSRGLRRGQRLHGRLRHQRLFGKRLGKLLGRGRLRRRPVGLGVRCGIRLGVGL